MANNTGNTPNADGFKDILELLKRMNYEYMNSNELLKRFRKQLRLQRGELYDLASVSKIIKGNFAELSEILAKIGEVKQEIERRDTAIADLCERMNKQEEDILKDLNTKEDCLRRIRDLNRDIKDADDRVRVKKRDIADEEENLRRTISSGGSASQVASIQSNLVALDAQLKAERAKKRELNTERNVVRLHRQRVNAITQLNDLTERSSELHNELNMEIEEGNILLEKREEIYNNIKKGLMASWGVVKNIANRWYEWQHIAYSTSRALGKDREEAEAFFNRSLRYTRELSKNYGISYEQITKFQSELSNALGRSVDMSRQQVESMAAMSALSSPEDANKMVDEMDRFGGSIQDASFYMELTQERAQKLGLNPVKAAKTIAESLKLASTYSFREGIDGLSKMALEAQRLRISMESVTQASENFNTIEGAIENSAKLQMLGGRFAAFGGNPMANLYNATSSQEDFFESVKQMFSNNGVFNRQTGVVEIDPITRRFIMEAAKSMGMNVGDALQMAQSSVKNREIESRLRYRDFTDAQRAFIESKAQYDAATQSFKITDEYTGQEHDISMLTPEDVQKLQANTIDEQHMFGDVRDIRNYLYNNVLGRQRTRAIRGMSYKENYEGMKEGIAATEVTAFNDAIGKSAADILNDTNSTVSKIYQWLVDNKWTTTIGHIVGAGLIAGMGGWVASKVGASFKYGAIARGFDEQLTNSLNKQNPAGPPPTPSGGSGGGGGRAMSRVRGLGKGLGKFGALAMVAGLAYSMFKDSGDSSNTSKSAELKELEKQTKLLESANGRMLQSDYNARPATTNVTVNNGTAGNGVDGGSDTPLGDKLSDGLGYAGLAAGTALMIDSFSGNKMSNKLASKGGAAGKLGKNLLKKGPGYGMLAGLGIDLAKGAFTDEGSTANKILSVLGDTVTFGALGAQVGGPWGGLIGGIAGLAKGLYDVSRQSSASPSVGEEKFENGGIVGGNHYTGDSVHARLNSGEMVIPRSKQEDLYNKLIGVPPISPDIKSLPVVGAATHIKNYNSSSYDVNKQLKVSPINMKIDVGGTIKLDLGGNYAKIDSEELMRSPEFKRRLAEIVSHRLNEASNAGKPNLESQRNNVASQYMGIGR